eukprot:maker-scaffold483_size159862-snap-gene-0.30 protein:Tk08687 transcript:maker-scaffold483_size159862-snap-gene-0.30-mRNA-1 annotation:"low quality protein: midasin"
MTYMPVLVTIAICFVSATQAGLICSLGQAVCDFHCNAFGQSTGVCNPRTHNCECSQIKIDNPLGTAVEGAIDNAVNSTTLALEGIPKVISNFGNRVANSNAVESLKEALSISCELDDDNSLCQRECNIRFFKTGTCNEADSRCRCGEERISGRDYALCGGLGVCDAFCQNKAFSFGVCNGQGNWTCQCVGKDVNGVEIFTDAPEVEGGENPLAREPGTARSDDSQENNDSEEQGEATEATDHAEDNESGADNLDKTIDQDAHNENADHSKESHDEKTKEF